MFINSTKTTLNAPKIAICSNDEEGFVAIQKIIQLFRWLNINTTFEFFEIAGKQYEKGLEYGISEPDLVRLKKTNILIHTKFDETFATNKKFTQLEYLNIAMRNLFIENFYDNNIKTTNKTDFFTQQQKYISNDNDFEIYTKELNTNNQQTNNDKLKFSKSFGNKYAIFSLYDYSDFTILTLMDEILNFANIKNDKRINEYQDIQTAISELKKQYKEEPTIINKLNYANEIKYNIEIQEFKQDLTNTATSLVGLFSVKQIVSSIKEKQVKIPDGMEISQIIADNIEVYPNIAFWEDNVLNPTIILRNELK